MSQVGKVQRDTNKSKTRMTDGDFTNLTNRVCGGDYDDACPNLLCGSVVWDQMDDGTISGGGRKE